LPRRSSNKAAALIIVLAFVVILAGLAVAYLSRATTDRQLAHTSFHDTDADLLAGSALDAVIGDFKQEIVNGSTKTSVGLTTIYVPTSAANMVPQRGSQIAAGVPNFIRRSVRSDLFSGNPAQPSRASAVNSQDNPSANNRSISSTRWNAHYLVPKGNTATSDSSPIPAFTNSTPDWVFVKAYDPVTKLAGPAVITSPDPLVVGRYAYAVYDEGGLLDMNVAGYPTGTSIYQYGRKGSLAFADLTAPLPYPIPNPSADNPPVYQVDRLVGWRNYGTTQPTNNFPDSNPASQAFARNFQTSTASATWFYNFVVNNTSGFLTVRSDPSPTPYPWNYLNVTGDSSPATYPWNGRTDQSFIQRQELIAYRKTTQFSANALGYLGSFSREAVAGVPQWSPATPTVTNPNFQTLVVTAAFPRNDGTTANVGDALVNKRFLLERLNWLTYRGPSATRTIPGSAPPLGNSNYDMWLLTSRFGLTTKFLQDSGVGGTAANILKYFGLVWDATSERWNYTSPSGGSLASSIATLGTLTGTREPDFFELLQAGIDNNSLGDSLSSDPALPSVHQASKILHILTIGANLIAQSRADSYPVRIACNIGGITMEAIGMPRLPCLSSLAACPIGATGLTGGVNWLVIPNLWDPFRDTWDLTEVNAGNTGNGPNLTPGYLRPQVRITIQGNITFAAANVSQSGSVDPSIFPLRLFTPTVGFNASLSLANGSNAFGRDGLLNAVRLGANDITDTLSVLEPTQSPPLLTTTAQWYRVHPPANDTSTYRGTPADDYVVFGLGLPGLLISPTNLVFGLKPVLIFQPGFQVSLDYQSPNGNWYSYSFLQGNNASTTWITAGPRGPLTIGTSYSEYGLNLTLPPLTALPTVINLGPLPVGTPTPWNDVTGGLAHAPMFAKSDPRSIRYNSMIGVVNVTNPPLPFNSAGVIGSIWPSPYSTPPPMSPSAFPTPTPTPNPNPATLGDNALAGNASNPYSETSGDAWRPVMMNRPFRSVGEMGYAFRDQPFRTLSFSSANSPDAALLDLFSVNDYSAPSSMRAGTISLNSQQPAALAAVLGSTIKREDTPRGGSPGAPTPLPLSTTDANNTAASLASLSSTAPVTNKAGMATLIANVPDSTGLGPSQPKTQRESIARALGEVDQTRTWNLLIDVVAQTGHFKPNAASLQNDFIVEGEEHYWVHVAIDRFTDQVLDKQVEVVKD
jgi:hypothetical protein